MYKHQIAEVIENVLAPLGSNEMQIRDACETMPARDLEVKDGALVLKGSDTLLDSDEGREWLRKNKGHLLPPESKPDEVAEVFATFNATKRQQLATKVGFEEANRLAQLHGFRSLFARERDPNFTPKDDGKPSTNPFLIKDEKLRTQKVTAAIKALGSAKVAALAKAAGTDLAGRPLARRA